MRNAIFQLFLLSLIVHVASFSGECNYDMRLWLQCVHIHSEECSQCGEISHRSVSLLDCTDFTAHFCEMEACCPPCADSTNDPQVPYGQIGDLRQLTSCIVGEGCFKPDCDAIHSTTQHCNTEYGDFSSSCRVDLPANLKTNKDVTPHTDRYFWLDFNRIMPSFASDSFSPQAIQECQTDADAFFGCGLSKGILNNETYYPRKYHSIQRCSYKHDLWTRCLRDNDCEKKCTNTPDMDCNEFTDSTCGKQCCCDSCDDLMEQYMSCAQETGECSGPTFECSERFCLSGATSYEW
eukprot:CAMPEP_0198115796 /NCGR_PEP_ID=MMETSP1442-20131203/7226_1 /TAXON_ID= /ORGANISM="Craspedostauros australis, Strain CCMP3328" /LENGTH=292 /DNA_ID=CAMNT_0043773373 /DNA_START=192 /DNA_END=1067 /DNA_ORIENTATION=-